MHGQQMVDTSIYMRVEYTCMYTSYMHIIFKRDRFIIVYTSLKALTVIGLIPVMAWLNTCMLHSTCTVCTCR